MNIMEEEDSKLSSSLQRLELEESKDIKQNQDINSFRRRSKSLSSCTNSDEKPMCKRIYRNEPLLAYRSLRNILLKQKRRKILKDPVLKIVKFKKRRERHTFSAKSGKLAVHNTSFNIAIRTWREQFREAWVHKQPFTPPANLMNLPDLERKEKYNARLRILSQPSLKVELNQIASCSQQARNNKNSNNNNNATPCDVTIDELASYFETSVHIPKKMSSMAEMMYI